MTSVFLPKITQKNYKENTCISAINGRTIVKFCTGVVHETSIPHTKQNSEIFTDVIDNDVVMLKSEHFRRKALNFKRPYLSSLWMKHAKKSWGD